jgi:NAD-dependent SIR2 family protein deacetylase
VQRRYWARSMIGWPVLSRARPNAGHVAIAGLEGIGRIGSVLTQNVDGLHGQAGSHGVLELHGNIHAVVCLDCSALFPRAFVQDQLERENPQMTAVRMRRPCRTATPPSNRRSWPRSACRTASTAAAP